MTGYVVQPSRPETRRISAKWRKMCASIPMPGQRPAVRRRSHWPTTTVSQANAPKPTNSTKEMSGRNSARTKSSAANYHLLEDRFKQGETRQLEKGDFCLSDRQPRPYWSVKAYILLGDYYLGKGDEFQARATHGRALQAAIRPTTTASSTKLQPASVSEPKIEKILLIAAL